MASENKLILQELKEIKSDLYRIENDVSVIKQRVIDPEKILTEDDLRAIDLALTEEKQERLLTKKQVFG